MVFDDLSVVEIMFNFDGKLFIECFGYGIMFVGEV